MNPNEVNFKLYRAYEKQNDQILKQITELENKISELDKQFAHNLSQMIKYTNRMNKEE